MPLIRNILVVGAGTLAARLSGFVRDVLTASVLGAGAAAEAYLAAFLAPNLVRRALGEGALNTAFVPALARRRAVAGEAGAARFAQAALGGFLLVATVAILAAELWMPGLIGLVAPGFASDTDKLAAATLNGRIAFLFVALVVVTACCSAVLNGLGHFAAPAFSGLIFNLVLIAALLALLLSGAPADWRAGLALSLAAVAAGAIQLFIVARAAARAGAPLRPLSPRRDPEVAALLVMTAPGLLVASSGHLNVLLAAALASSQPQALAWLYYADRLFQLPTGFAAAAVGIVLLPAMARAIQSADRAAARGAFSRALEFSLALSLPAAVALFLLAEPIVDIVYRRGAFSGGDALAVALFLQTLALAMPAAALSVVFLAAYAARERLRLPVFATLLCLAVNAAAASALQPVIGVAAAPAGVAAGAWAQALVLGSGLAAVGGLAPDPEAARRLPRLVLAAAGTGLMVYLALSVIGFALDAAQGTILRIAVLAGLVVFGLAVHLGLALALRTVDVAGLKAAFSRSP